MTPWMIALFLGLPLLVGIYLGYDAERWEQSVNGWSAIGALPAILAALAALVAFLVAFLAGALHLATGVDPVSTAGGVFSFANGLPAVVGSLSIAYSLVVLAAWLVHRRGESDRRRAQGRAEPPGMLRWLRIRRQARRLSSR